MTGATVEPGVRAEPVGGARGARRTLGEASAARMASRTCGALGFASGACPTDVPKGVTARPSCVLKSSAGAQFCALVCTPSGSGADNALELRGNIAGWRGGVRRIGGIEGYSFVYCNNN